MTLVFSLKFTDKVTLSSSPNSLRPSLKTQLTLEIEWLVQFLWKWLVTESSCGNPDHSRTWASATILLNRNLIPTSFIKKSKFGLCHFIYYFNLFPEGPPSSKTKSSGARHNKMTDDWSCREKVNWFNNRNNSVAQISVCNSVECYLLGECFLLGFSSS